MALNQPVTAKNMRACLARTFPVDLEKMDVVLNEIKSIQNTSPGSLTTIKNIQEAMDLAFEYGASILKNGNYIPKWLLKDAKFLILSFHRTRMRPDSAYHYHSIDAEIVSQATTSCNTWIQPKSARMARYHIGMRLPEISVFDIIMSYNNATRIHNEFAKLIDNNMVLNVRKEHVRSASSEQGYLILPYSGENLTKHAAIRNMVEKLQSVFTEDMIAKIHETENSSYNLDTARNEYLSLKHHTSRKMAKTEDFFEIANIVLPETSTIYMEDIANACHLANKTRTNISEMAESIIKIRHEKMIDATSRISKMPDQDDAAILWIGLSKGEWDIAA